MSGTTEVFVNYYEILPGIVETSQEDAIRKAIREQRQIWNKRAAQADPVKREQAQKRVRDLGDAERVLLDPARKQAFDEQAAGGQGLITNHFRRQSKTRTARH